MYGYGYRYNSGLVVSAGGGAPFANTYSLDFDGIDDYFDTGYSYDATVNNNLSLSFWINSTRSGTFIFPLSITTGAGASGYPNAIVMIWNKKLLIQDRTGWNFGSALINDGNWHNIVVTAAYSGNTTAGTNLNMYVDGNLTPDISTSTMSSGTNSYLQGTLFLGNFNGVDKPMTCILDEVAVWESILSTEEITSLYNSGTPTTISGAVAWYRMGDNGAWKSPQWLIPNNENKDKVSNYSFEFDGVDDYLVIANNTTIGRTQNISFSVWVNLGATSRQYIIGNTTSSNGGAGLAVESGNNLVFQIGNGSNDSFFNSRVSSFSTYAPINTWNHILATWDGTDSKIYINGILRNTWSPTLPYIINYSGAFDIGWRGFGAYKTNGKLDELALFDSGVSIGDVYDGSGQPIDVSAVSGITNNWRMGEEATFSGGVWTVPDAVGSNNGTSNGMTIEDRIGEAPNSASNSVSYNMDEVDRVTDTP